MCWFVHCCCKSLEVIMKERKTNIIASAAQKWGTWIFVSSLARLWHKYFLRIPMGFQRLHEWESSVGSQECPSVLCSIRISMLMNPSWLAGLARKRRSNDASARKDFRGPQPRKAWAKAVHCLCFNLQIYTSVYKAAGSNQTRAVLIHILHRLP